MSCNAIHILGASGSGTTTLAKAISGYYGFLHLDADDFFWEKTNPPFTRKRAYANRQTLMAEAIAGAEKCVISGSMEGWGNIFIPQLELVIYVHTPTEVRIERLRRREREKFGSRILPGGDMYENHEEFIKWASAYDFGGLEIRSARLHKEWLKQITCPVVTLDGQCACDENLKHLEKYFV